MKMRALVLENQGAPPVLKELPRPSPGPGQVVIQVAACALCRTDLHIIDGELSHPKLPLVLGHQVVGHVVERGAGVASSWQGARVGLPWLGGSCGQCRYCQEGRENLCDHALYTGYQIDGGLADYCVANASYIFPLPPTYSDTEAAPLLCGGMIGYRALKLAQPAQKIGFFGFGAAAHLLVQVVKFQGGEVFAFTRPGDLEGQKIAKKLGAVWAGSAEEKSPQLLDAALIFAPVGELIPVALQAVKKGGTVVCAGIHMSPIPSFPYELLWEERILRTVANLTRKDGEEFLALAPQIPLHSTVTTYPLEEAHKALNALRKGTLCGAGVIVL